MKIFVRSCILVAALLFVQLVTPLLLQAASGGPDTFGYTWRDNSPATGGCEYNFIDIASTGTAIGTGDDSVFSGIPIGFNFDYYGTNYTSVNVSTNGFISLSTAGSSFSNTCPIPVTLNDLQISPFWDDGYVFAPSSLLYQTVGTAPNRTFIVQWNNVGFCCTSPPAGAGMTYQVQLFESSNIIAFMYNDVQQTTRTQGDSATIGIDGPGTTNFLSYMCNQTTSPGPLTNGRGVFFLPPGVTACGSVSTISGTVTYTGNHTSGNLKVTAFDGPACGEGASYDAPDIPISGPGPYNFTIFGLPVPGTYVVCAYIDLNNSSGSPDPNEPSGQYSGTVSLTVGAPNPTGIDVSLFDQITAVPSMTEVGLVVFIILAGFGAAVYLRRQRKATR